MFTNITDAEQRGFGSTLLFAALLSVYLLWRVSGKLNGSSDELAYS